MTKNSFIGWAGLVLAILALVLGTLNLHGGSTQQALGGASGGPSFNAGANFPVGLTVGFGSLARTQNAAVIQVPLGSNQASWKNTTGRTVYVNFADIEMAGTASSTFKAYVGTSTTATVTNVFSLTTAPMWSQLIDGAQIATSTVAGLWADNISNHKTSYPGTIAVSAGQYLVLVANTFCKSNGACETATSSNRGWTTLTMPFRYAQ